ncbi:MAG: flagellar hook assembly protein FlgD [Methylococcaceae bacterium]|nr:flagellar hook assembly protein FlgD [Methylococcaceae bacterium]
MTTTSAVNQNSKLTATTAKTDAPVKKGVDGALNQAQFLKLMTTQMTHQDPSKPMENGDFLAQMAQFGTVSGIQDLQKSFSEFASSIGSGQALQATGLVGHTVLAPASKGMLETGKPLIGNISLTDSTPNLTLKIINSKTGEEVNNLQLGSQVKGAVPFSWDGLDAQGKMADPRMYKVVASSVLDGKETAMETQVQSRVESVTMGSGTNGLSVNLAGGGSVNFNQVKQIL